LAWAALLEVVHGKGRYLLSQLELVSKFRTEPVCRRILVNLLTYADAFDRREPGPLGIVASPGGALGKFLTSLKVKYDDLAGFATDLAPLSAIIVEGTAARAETFKDKVAQLKRHLERGGTVWLHDLAPGSEEIVRSLGADDPGQLVEPAGGYRPYGIISDDSLVSGLSNFDIYWHQARGARRVLPSAQHLWRRTASSAGTVLAEQEGGLAALVRVRVGTGLLVLDQITWDRQTTFKSQAERYFSTLATNAGIAFAPAGVQSNVRADDFHMIDLAVSAER